MAKHNRAPHPCQRCGQWMSAELIGTRLSNHNKARRVVFAKKRIARSKFTYCSSVQLMKQK